MYDPAIARNILIVAEIAAIAAAVVSRRLAADVTSLTVARMLTVCWALAVTVAVFIPFTFFYVFTGAGPEFSLATFPITLIAAPVVFFILLARSRD